MKQVKQSAIEQLRNKEVALQFNGNVELLQCILKAAFPTQRLEASGVSDFYIATGTGEWTYWSYCNPSGKPDVDANIPIQPMSYFLEDSLIVAAERIAENSIYGRVDYDVSDLTMVYITKSGQEVILSAQDVECISQFKPRVKEVEMTEAEFEEFMESKGWPEPTKYANRMNFSGILKSETVTQYSYPVKLS